MKKRMIMMASCLLLTAGLTAQAAWAQEAKTVFGAPQGAAQEEEMEEGLEDEKRAEMEAEKKEDLPDEMNGTPAAQTNEELGELYDFRAVIDGELYAFPMTVAEFVEKGWTVDEDWDELLAPNQYGLISVKKSGGFSSDGATALIINFDINCRAIEDCMVGGLSIDSFYIKTENGLQTELTGGIRRLESTEEDIRAAYGDPTSEYESDYYTKLEYEKDYGESVVLKVGAESGVLEDIEIRNFTVPADFEYGEPSDEVPEDVAAYERPAALGDDLTSFTVNYEGCVYKLPVPVSVLEEDGWTIDPEDSDSVISAKSYGRVTLRKDNDLSFYVYVDNDASYATNPSNCWITDLDAGSYSTENVTMELPGGISYGMSGTDLVAALDATGYPYETDEGSSYISYRLKDENYNGYTFTVSTEETGFCDPDIVYSMEIECRK